MGQWEKFIYHGLSFGETFEPGLYWITDYLEKSVEIYEYNGKDWKPYIADDVLVRFCHDVSSIVYKLQVEVCCSLTMVTYDIQISNTTTIPKAIPWCASNPIEQNRERSLVFQGTRQLEDFYKGKVIKQ